MTMRHPVGSVGRVGLGPGAGPRLILLVAFTAALLLAPPPPVAEGAEDAASADHAQHPARRQFPLEQFSLETLEEEAESWLDRPYLTGDWGGLRTRLLRLGVAPTLTFVTDVLGNPVGGESKALRETDNLGLDVGFDLQRLLGWAGGLFHVSFSLRSGKSLSDEAIGNVFNVAQVCCAHTFRLVDVYFEQSLLGDALNIQAGRIAAGDDFLTSPLYWSFVQSGINGNPAGIFFNVPLSVYPTATWGLRALAAPLRSLYVMAGVYNGDATLGANDKHGVDWSMRGPLFAIAEIGYRLNQGPGATGLAGNYKIGGYYDDGEFPDLFRDIAGGSAASSGLPPQMHHGNGGFYVLMDQMVYREGGPGSRQGLTPFVALLFAPDTSVNALPFFVNGGLVYRGLLPARPKDTLGVGAIYGAFSDQLRRSQRDARRAGASGTGVQTSELALEMTYTIRVAPSVQVQPDVQYIINPGGSRKIPDALVIGFQLSLNL